MRATLRVVVVAALVTAAFTVVVALRAGQSEASARRALGFFPGFYQGDVRPASPLFGRATGTRISA